MCHLPATRLRNLALFVTIFGAAWIAFVIVIWKLDWVPVQLRPWLRTVVWCTAAAAWIAWQRPPRPLHWLGLAPASLGVIAVSIAAFAILVIWNLWRVSFFGANSARLAALDAGAHVWIVVGVFVEELVFRGVVQTRLTEVLSPLLAIAISVLLFLAFHVPGWVILAIPIGPVEVVTIIALGSVAGVIRYWTGSLWPAVAAHWANNLGAML
jgi:membrane protease YdiL (CAAX protease family)